MMDERALGAYLDNAESVLFRLEVRDAYDVTSDGGDYNRYVRGEPGPDPQRKAPWLARLREDRNRGLRNLRVHVVRSPLSSYLRYECEWGYAPNAEAGEEIRILDLAETAAPQALVEEDFWLVDGQAAVLMHYNERSQFTGAEVLPPSALPRYRAAAQAAWDAARPFDDYWNAHRHYWRGAA